MSSEEFDILFDPRFANVAKRKIITKKSGEENLGKCKSVHEVIGLSIPSTPLPEPAASGKSWSPSDDRDISVPPQPAPPAVQQGRTPHTTNPFRILSRPTMLTSANAPNNEQLHDFSVPRVPSLRKEDVHATPLKRPPRDVASNGLSVSSYSTEDGVVKPPKKYANYGGMRYEIVGDDRPAPAPLSSHPIKRNDKGVALKRRTRIRLLGATPPHVEEIRHERQEPTPFADMKQRELESAREAGVPDVYGGPKDRARIWRWLHAVPVEQGPKEDVWKRENEEEVWRKVWEPDR